MTTTLSSLSPSPARTGRSALAGVTALLAAVAYLVLAGIQLTNPPFDGTLTSPIDYANDASFMAGMLFTIATLIGLRKHCGASKGAVIIATVGLAMVSAGVSVALVTGSDPEWFVVLGLPGNLLAWAGHIWLGVWAWRRRALPRWVAALLFVVVPVTLLLADLGGGILAGMLWCGIGAHLLRQPAAS